MNERKFLVGLIGANIMKSLSPAMHAEAFAAAGIEGYYHVMDVDVLPGRRLPQLLEAVKTAGFSGTNVTYPFKQEVLALLDEVDREAAQIGAVNTVTIAPDGRTKGYNTDRLRFPPQLRGRARPRQRGSRDRGAGRCRRRRTRGCLCADGPRRGDGGGA